MAVTTLDPATLGANTVLSNGNLTAISNSVAATGARGTTYKTSGKWYFEFDNAGASGMSNNDLAGVCLASATYTNIVNSNYARLAAGAFGAGSMYVNGSGASRFISTINTSGWCAVAVDMDNLRFWMKQSAVSGSWNATSGTAYNPTTSSTGIDISALSAGVTPVIATKNNGSGAVFNFGATAFTGTIPSGFQAWDPVVATIAPLVIVMG